MLDVKQPKILMFDVIEGKILVFSVFEIPPSRPSLVRLKSDQVEQMTHTLYFITPLCLSRVAALC